MPTGLSAGCDMPSRRGRLSRKTWGMGEGVRSLSHLPGAMPPCPHLLPPTWVCNPLERHRLGHPDAMLGLCRPMLSMGHGAMLVPISSPTPFTSLIQSDMMWVLGVRKWKLRTTTQITTTAVTRSMIKSRYLWRAWTWSWHCHRGWA